MRRFELKSLKFYYNNIKLRKNNYKFSYIISTFLININYLTRSRK